MERAAKRVYSVYLEVAPVSRQEESVTSSASEDILESISEKISALHPRAGAALGLLDRGGVYNIDAQMDVEASSASAAKNEALSIVENGYGEVLGAFRGGEDSTEDPLLEIRRSEVETLEDHKVDPRGSTFTPKEERFCGVSEVGKLLGLKNRQHAATVVRRWEFPRPIQVLAMGPIWREEEVLEYAREHGFGEGGAKR